jgi:2-polyprenyl-3-methyl-5-hydroxy-6-metoxy-1,4-benzoquinol methylase
MIYTAVNNLVLRQVPPQAGRILDVGCGNGALGKVVKQQRECEVVGITYSAEEAKIARKVLDDVIVENIDLYNFSKLGKFDCIICSHVLEHLHDPGKILLQLHENLADGGTLIVALPNVLFFKQRWEFIIGKFEYSDAGIMDRTHLHFYDWEQACQLLVKNKWIVVQRIADAYFPLPFIRGHIRPIASILDNFVGKYFPGIFAQQIVIVAKKKA